MTLSERDKKVIWHPFTQMKKDVALPGIVRGKGVYLEDESGKKYIDAISSWWVNLHGHSHPYIAEKVSAQLNTLEHVIFAGFTHQPAVELAERLLHLLPGNQSRIFYSDNGSTAVEVAVKMAIQFWKNQGKERNLVIALEGAYHGDTFGAMSVSDRNAFTKPFQSLLFEVVHIPVPVKGREEEVLSRLKSVLHDRPDEVAAFLFEPLVLGSGGMIMYEPEVLDQMIAVCREYDAITIADEVMTGFGRTGKNFACDHLQQQADIMCLSKGLTGGTMAMGITSCTDKIYQGFLSDDKAHTFYHGHSYTANPLACVAGLASMDILLSEECQRSIRHIEELQRSFAQKIESHPSVSNARVSGTIMAFDYVTPGDTSYFNPVRDRLYDFFVQEGVLLRPLGNTVYIMPPYCITEEELAAVHAVIEKKLNAE